MKPTILLVLVFLFLPRPLPTVAAQCKRGCALALAAYYLSEGDNLIRISSYFDKAFYSQVLPYNNRSQIQNDTHFLPGVRMYIPFTCDCQPAPDPDPDRTPILAHTFSYDLQEGDTYYVMATSALANLTTYTWLGQVNSYTPETMFLYTNVNVTVNCSCGDESVSRDYGLFATYPLRPGETLASLAAEAGVPTEVVRAYNPGVDFESGQGLVFLPAKDQNGSFPRLQLRKGRKRVAVLGVISAAILAVLILAFGLYFILYKRKRSAFGKSSGTSVAVLRNNHLLKSNIPAPGRLVEFSFEELAEATGNFTRNKIGEGGFGFVYYAELRGERTAVKSMKSQDLKEFLAELKVMANVNHVNLVSLVGYCIKNGLFLVSEFVENGNLSEHLQNSERRPLSWSARLQIALDSARGLEYIHEHTNPAYIHRDVKSSNILIDENFHGKVADFGLAKLTESQSGASHTSKAKGTLGYMPPEYVQFGIQSTKVDVYAFGVVLFELISAREAIVMVGVHSIEYRKLAALFSDALAAPESEKALRELVDSRLGDDCPIDAVHKMALLARTCTLDEATHRPSMKNVVVALAMISSATEDWNVGLFVEDETLRNFSGR